MERQLGELRNRREETDVGTGFRTWGGGGLCSESAEMPSPKPRHVLAPSGQGPLAWPAPASRLSHRPGSSKWEVDRRQEGQRK